MVNDSDLKKDLIEYLHSKKNQKIKNIEKKIEKCQNMMEGRKKKNSIIREISRMFGLINTNSLEMEFIHNSFRQERDVEQTLNTIARMFILKNFLEINSKKKEVDDIGLREVKITKHLPYFWTIEIDRLLFDGCLKWGWGNYNETLAKRDGLNQIVKNLKKNKKNTFSFKKDEVHDESTMTMKKVEKEDYNHSESVSSKAYKTKKIHWNYNLQMYRFASFCKILKKDVNQTKKQISLKLKEFEKRKKRKKNKENTKRRKEQRNKEKKERKL